MHPVDAPATARLSARNDINSPLKSPAFPNTPFGGPSSWSPIRTNDPAMPSPSIVISGTMTQSPGARNSAYPDSPPTITYQPRVATPPFARDTIKPSTVQRIATPSDSSSLVISEGSSESLPKATRNNVGDERTVKPATGAATGPLPAQFADATPPQQQQHEQQKQQRQYLQHACSTTFPTSPVSQQGTFFAESGSTRIVYQSPASCARTFIPNSFPPITMPRAPTTGGAMLFGTTIQEGSQQLEGHPLSGTQLNTGRTMVTIRQGSSPGVRVHIKPSASFDQRSLVASSTYAAAGPPSSTLPSSHAPNVYTLPSARPVPAPHALHSASNITPTPLPAVSSTMPLKLDTPSEAQLHGNIQVLLAYAQRAAEAAERSAKACELMTSERGPSRMSVGMSGRTAAASTILQREMGSVCESIVEDDSQFSSGPSMEEDLRVIQELEMEIQEVNEENETFNIEELSPTLLSGVAFGTVDGIKDHLFAHSSIESPDSKMTGKFHIGTPTRSTATNGALRHPLPYNEEQSERRWSVSDLDSKAGCKFNIGTPRGGSVATGQLGRHRSHNDAQSEQRWSRSDQSDGASPVTGQYRLSYVYNSLGPISPNIK
eukprot:GEMP01019365.1.p1 GENE.GEMP01019365.1~~GEMP01019365.1.p1  ORF type:complete len:603 (+),score=108.86 GEMP01019365.1:395-2203(+)